MRNITKEEIINHHYQVVNLLQTHFKGRDIKGVEIGTAGAPLTKTLLGFVDNITKLYTIDPWERTEGSQYGSFFSLEQLAAAKEQAHKVLKRHGDRVVIIPKKSDDAVVDIKEKVDFVWIDGNHDGDQVERDIDNYIPLINEGGILGGHDYVYAVNATKIIDKKFKDRLNLGFDATWWVYL